MMFVVLRGMTGIYQKQRQNLGIITLAKKMVTQNCADG